MILQQHYPNNCPFGSYSEYSDFLQALLEKHHYSIESRDLNVSSIRGLVCDY